MIICHSGIPMFCIPSVVEGNRDREKILSSFWRLPAGTEYAELNECDKRLHSIVVEAQTRNESLQRIVRSHVIQCLSSASYRTDDPSQSILQVSKLNPIIRPLMDGLKVRDTAAGVEILSKIGMAEKIPNFHPAV